MQDNNQDFDFGWALRLWGGTFSLGLLYLVVLVSTVAIGGTDQILQALRNLGKWWIEFLFATGCGHETCCGLKNKNNKMRDGVIHNFWIQS